MSARIRAADMLDADALARIHATCFEAAWDGASFRAFLNRPGMLAFVATATDAAETDLQAFILVQIAADEAEIISLGTHPPARRLGLARALLVHAAAEAARRSAGAMYLDVAEDNSAALALYRGLGFIVRARRKAYYQREGQSADALVLRRPLP
jgi:ribosomal-protein-alanine N-acetyltransferase